MKTIDRFLREIFNRFEEFMRENITTAELDYLRIPVKSDKGKPKQKIRNIR